MSAYSPDSSSYTFEQLNVMKNRQYKSRDEWDKHKKSPECKGENCPKCDEFKLRINAEEPLA